MPRLPPTNAGRRRGVADDIVADDIVVVDPVGGAKLELGAEDDASLLASSQTAADYEIAVQ